jgi:hypothetical protein
MIRIKTDDFLCIYKDKMIEISAKTKEEANKKAQNYFKIDEENGADFCICKIPSSIGVLIDLDFEF